MTVATHASRKVRKPDIAHNLQHAHLDQSAQRRDESLRAQAQPNQKSLYR